MPSSPAQGRGCRVFAPVQKRVSILNDHSFSNLVQRDFIEVQGQIHSSTLWAADTVLVTGNITIMPQAVLSIDPGVQVIFTDYHKIEVLGSIRAQGTADQRILFTSQQPQDFDLDASHRGAWNGIRFPFTSACQDSSLFSFCLFEYAKSTADSSQAGAVFSLNNFSKLRVENCIIRNNLALRGGAVACRTLSCPVFASNLFTDNYCLLTGSVFYNEYSCPLIINNTLVYNQSINPDEWMPSCALTNMFSKPVLHNNIIFYNSTIYFLSGQIFEPRPFYYGINNIDQELNQQNISQPGLLESDYAPLPGSVCIDAGSLEYINYLPQLDITGADRISGSQIDLGCYEYQFTNSTSDLLQIPAVKVFPNPFNPSVQVDFKLASPASVDFAVYNVKGEKIWQNSSICLPAGNQILSWNGITTSGKSAPSGLYFLQISTPDFKTLKKITLLK